MSYNEAMTIKKTKDLESLLKSFGFSLARQNGSHLIYKNASAGKSVSFPAGREIARGTLRNVLKQVYA